DAPGARGPGGPGPCRRDPDGGHAVEEPFDADTGLGPSQGSTRAGVDAEPEGQVLADVRPVEVELGRALEPARVTVGGTVEHHQGGAGRDVDPADGRRDAREPEG